MLIFFECFPRGFCLRAGPTVSPSPAVSAPVQSVGDCGISLASLSPSLCLTGAGLRGFAAVLLTGGLIYPQAGKVAAIESGPFSPL